MSLREKIKSASAAAVKSELITLPVAGAEVLVKGLLLGDRLRVAEAKGATKGVPLLIALSAHDPAGGAPIWNANSLPDVQEIEALNGADADILATTAQRLSGIEPGKAEE